MATDRQSTADRFLEHLQPLERELEAYARRLSWEPQQAPDALQNAVLRAYTAFDRYREGTSFRAWMFKILTREVFALNRKHARIARHEFQLEPEELAALAGPGATGDARDWAPNLDALADTLEPALLRALRNLTDLERAVLLLRAIGGFRYREISVALDIPLGSVMGDLARARQKLRLTLTYRSTGSRFNPRTHHELH